MYQLVFRKKPRYRPYIRLKPESRSPNQLIARELMRIATTLSSKMGLEEIAYLVGGKVYDRERNLIEVDGEVLPKTAALVRYLMKNRYIGRTRKPRKWEIHLSQYISLSLFERILSEVSAEAVPARIRR